MLQDHASPRASAPGEAPNAAQCSDNQVDVRSAVETPPANIDKATAAKLSVVPAQVTKFNAVIHALLQTSRLVLCRRTGDPYIVVDIGNPSVQRVGSSACDALIRQAGLPCGLLLRQRDIDDINEDLRALAIQLGEGC